MKSLRKRINSDNYYSDESDDIEYIPKKQTHSAKKRKYNDIDINSIENINNINDDINIDISCKSNTCTHCASNKKINIKEIKIIKDLINFGREYNCISQKSYNGINLRILNNLIEPLIELDNMIGLIDLKTKLIEQIMYICRGYNSIPCKKCIDCHLKIACVSNSKEMLHTVITGPPGVGKTQFARILAKVYAKCGFVKNDKFIEVTRKDLISGYLGRTAKKTNKIFKRAKNGVIFIDEAYSLGNTGNEDSYSKECIDIINKQLSENKDIIVIIAGYKEEIDSCFFRVNPGLERRFPFKYNINGYNGEELFTILEQKIKQDGWIILEKDYQQIKKYIISKHIEYKNFAGDMITLLMGAKIKNSRNINSKNYVLTYKDFC
jgi:SpoVK/Ycf46/Vps4 family AAA+-type ATPase